MILWIRFPHTYSTLDSIPIEMGPMGLRKSGKRNYTYLVAYTYLEGTTQTVHYLLTLKELHSLLPPTYTVLYKLGLGVQYFYRTVYNDGSKILSGSVWFLLGNCLRSVGSCLLGSFYCPLWDFLHNFAH